MRNTFGPGAGVNNLSGKTPQQAEWIFLQRFLLNDQKDGHLVDAEIMAAALNVYATNASLGGAQAASYGFRVSQYGLGDSTWNVGVNGAVAGVANNATLTVLQILQNADQQSVNGVLYGGNVLRRKLASSLFDAINSKGRI